MGLATAGQFTCPPPRSADIPVGSALAACTADARTDDLSAMADARPRLLHLPAPMRVQLGWLWNGTVGEVASAGVYQLANLGTGTGKITVNAM